MGNADPAGTLQTPAALAQLLRLVDDHGVVHTLATSYPDWGALVRAAGTELGWRIGPRGAQLRLPAAPPALQPLPAEVRAVTRYEDDYPAELAELTTPPVLIYVRGTLPSGMPRLVVGGAHHPSVTGVQVARAAARAAAAQQVPLVAALDGLLGSTALAEVVDAGGQAVAVTTTGFGVAGPHDALLDRVVAAGGAVLTVTAPGERGAGVGSAAEVATALGTAVVLAEVGLHETAGAALARAAIGCGRFLIIPAPQRALHTPDSAAGGPALAQARSFSSTMYGTSPRIAARVANGLSPADAVVSTSAQLAHAITLGCRPQPAAAQG